MRIVHHIPTPLIQKWSSIQSFVVTTLFPTISASEPAISAIKSLSPFSSKNPKTPTEKEQAEEEKAEKLTGQPKALRDEITKVGLTYVFKEDTSAVNSEAILCLKKLGAGYWGVCEDIGLFAYMLVKLEKEGREGWGGGKLRVEAFFAEEDVMIGKMGEDYFRRCFRRDVRADEFEFEAMVIEGTDHENLADCWKGALERVFEGAREGLV